MIAHFRQNLKIATKLTHPNKTKKFNCAGCQKVDDEHRNDEQSDIEMVELVGINIDEIPTGPLSSHENCNIEPKLSENSLKSHRSPVHTLGVYQNCSSNDAQDALNEYWRPIDSFQHGQNILQSSNHLEDIPSSSNSQIENPLNVHRPPAEAHQSSNGELKY